MKKYIQCFWAIIGFAVARIIPFSFVIGSHDTCFSWSTIMAPIMSQYIGLWSITLFFVPFKHSAITFLVYTLLHRMPLFGASLAYTKPHVITWCAVPTVCIIGFVVHPVGGQAWLYSMYWLAPIILWAMSDRYNVWTRSIAAVFVAHAIGSVVWLYTVDIDVCVWLSLIPVVVIERLSMAFGIVAFDAVIQARCSIKNIFCVQLLKRLS